MDAKIYNLNNEEVGQVSLSDKIFGVSWNPDLVHFAYEAQRANAREPLAHVKDRSEVKGGGKKPWRQKGTGRARHGSIRSPLWIGGGATHGPLKQKSFAKKINKKQRQHAIFSVISKRLQDESLKIVDSFNPQNLAQVKTKDLAQGLRGLFPGRLNSVLVASPANRSVSLSTRNIPGLKPVAPESLNVVDLLNHRCLIIENSALATINKRLLGSQE